jgi:hypothetical protein
MREGSRTICPIRKNGIARRGIKELTAAGLKEGWGNKEDEMREGG